MSDGAIRIRVYGVPQPAAKKNVVRISLGGGRVRLVPVDKDYRTRKDPVTGKIEKYDHGYKKKWMEHVRWTVASYMQDHNLKPFKKNEPIGLGTLFYIPKSASNKLPYPSQAPDEDNYVYAVRNCLKRTPGKNKNGRHIDGEYPDGVLYYDDDQIIWTLQPTGKLWATEEEPPGVLITVKAAPFEEITEWAR